MSNIISPKSVEYEGPDDAKIMIVGEAPGEWEDRLGRPFVSKDVAKTYGFSIENNTAGDLLERYLGRLGVSRDRVYLANLSKHRPPNNRFQALLGTSVLEGDLLALGETIERVRPNVIIGVGGWPTWYLAGKCGKDQKSKKPKPGTGITTYRGSRYAEILKTNEIKTFCMHHPAAILRNFKLNPLFFWDLQKGVEDGEFPELRYPKYEKFIDPSPDLAYELVNEAIGSGTISLDIETFPNRTFSCVGFAWRGRAGSLRAACLTFKRKDLWRFAREVWESDTPKVLQYGTYDINFMKRFYDWNIGGYYDGKGWDTYIASASILPDWERSLDFLTSIHTRMPYYKTERKEWKEKMDFSILWKYNMKDTIATYLIMEEQQKVIGIKLFNSKAA